MIGGILAIAMLQTLSGTAARDLVTSGVRAFEADSAAPLEQRYRAQLRRNPTDRAARLGLANLALLRYDYTTADRLAQALGPARDPIAVRGLLLLANSAGARARFAAADSFLTEAVRVAETIGDSLGLAEGLIGSASFRFRTAGAAAADSILDRAAALVRSSDLRTGAALRCGRALLLAGRSRPEARAEARAAADLARRAGEARLRNHCLVVVAQDHLRVGQLDSAETVFKEALASQRRLKDRGGAAITLQWFGWLQLLGAQMGSALVTLREAVALGTAVGNPTPVAWASLSLADIATRIGDRDAATGHAERAVAMFEASGDRLGAANARAILGDVARAAGETARARALYRPELAAAEREGRVLSRISLHRGLADLAMMERDWATAADEIRAAARVARDHKLAAWEKAGEVLNAILGLRRGDLDEAARALHAFDAERVSPTDFYRLRTLWAEWFARRGMIDSAEAAFTQASDGLERWRAGLTDQQLRQTAFQATGTFADPDLGVATIIGALATRGRVTSAFALAERRRARDLLDRLLRDQALGTGTAPGRRRPAAPTLTAAEVMARLPDDRTALFQYVTGRVDEPTTLLVLTKSGIVAHSLAPIDSLLGSVGRFVRLTEAGAAVPDLAAELGQALLRRGLEGLDRSVTRLVIVRDDILHRLPFDALVVGGGDPIVERYAVSYAPSATVAVGTGSSEPRAGPPSALVFGDPVFGPVEPGSGFAEAGGLPRLSASGREARTVGRFFPAADVRLRADASEAWLKQAPLRRYSVLHFATHAWVDDRNLARTALALAPGSGEDGLIRPGDLAGLDLDADLVVLSACGTAGGIILRGEGLVGLTAPLMAAGARSIVATGWRIGDRSAGRLVAGFYEGLSRGLPASDALQGAKRAARRSGMPTSEWAAFALVGDPLVRLELVRDR